MEPGSEFWAKVGEGVANSPSGLVLGALAVIALAVVVARWGLPVYERLRSRKLDNDRYRIEVDERAAKALDERERERIRVTQRQVAAQEESTRAVEALSTQTAALNAQIEESKSRSRDMGRMVSEAGEAIGHVATQVDEIHAIVVRRERQ